MSGANRVRSEDEKQIALLFWEHFNRPVPEEVQAAHLELLYSEASLASGTGLIAGRRFYRANSLMVAGLAVAAALLLGFSLLDEPAKTTRTVNVGVSSDWPGVAPNGPSTTEPVARKLTLDSVDDRDPLLPIGPPPTSQSADSENRSAQQSEPSDTPATRSTQPSAAEIPENETSSKATPVTEAAAPELAAPAPTVTPALAGETTATTARVTTTTTVAQTTTSSTVELPTSTVVEPIPAPPNGVSIQERLAEALDSFNTCLGGDATLFVGYPGQSDHPRARTAAYQSAIDRCNRFTDMRTVLADQAATEATLSSGQRGVVNEARTRVHQCLSSMGWDVGSVVINSRGFVTASRFPEVSWGDVATGRFDREFTECGWFDLEIG